MLRQFVVGFGRGTSSDPRSLHRLASTGGGSEGGRDLARSSSQVIPNAISHGPAHSPDPSKGYYPAERVLPLVAWPSEVLGGFTLEHGVVFLALWRQNTVRVKNTFHKGLPPLEDTLGSRKRAPSLSCLIF